MSFKSPFPRFTPWEPGDNKRRPYIFAIDCHDCGAKIETRITVARARFLEEMEEAPTCSQCGSKDIIWTIKEHEGVDDHDGQDHA